MITIRRTPPGRNLTHCPARDLDDLPVMHLLIATIHRAEHDAKSSNRRLRRAARRWLAQVRQAERGRV